MRKHPLSKSAQAVREAFTLGYRVDHRGRVFNPQGMRLKPWPSPDGYLRFSLSKTRKVMVHSLQGYQKYGERALAEGVDLRHRNGDRRDNRRANIRIGTRSRNMLDRPAKERQAHGSYAASFTRKLRRQDINRIWRMRRLAATYTTIAAELHISMSQVHDIMYGKLYAEWRPLDADWLLPKRFSR